MGEKVGQVIQLLATFLGEFIIAFVRGWKLTLLMLVTIPPLVLVSAALMTIVSKATSRGQEAYAEAGDVVEQAIGAIRTIAASVGEKKSIEAYTKRLKTAYKASILQGLAFGLGVGAFMFIVFCSYSLAFCNRNKGLPIKEDDAMQKLSYEEQRRNTMFMDRIPFSMAISCYVVLAVVSTIVMPRIFAQVKWYYVFLSYCVAPILGFCNAYGCGLTDWSLASTYGKLGLFIFSAWAGSHGGILVGLVSCGVMMVVVACSADLMQDFKTGYLTLSSPRSMFASQVLGTLMGCIIAPLTFWLFWKAFDVGNPKGEYKAPYALIYREMATIGVQGFGALPKHCLDLCYAFFSLAIIVNFLRDKPLARWAGYIPIPMAMAIPFYIGPYFAIDMFVGTVIVYVWEWRNRKKAKLLVPAVASGLICGDGIWTLIAAILALARRQAPICMYFLPSSIVDSLQLPAY